MSKNQKMKIKNRLVQSISLKNVPIMTTCCRKIQGLAQQELDLEPRVDPSGGDTRVYRWVGGQTPDHTRRGSSLVQISENFPRQIFPYINSISIPEYLLEQSSWPMQMYILYHSKKNNEVTQNTKTTKHKKLIIFSKEINPGNKFLEAYGLFFKVAKFK